MPKKELETVKELLYWSYANLAMAHSAVEKKQEKYRSFNFMIRAKLFKGLMTGTMNIRTIFDDEKIKLNSGQKCSYCGNTNNLALDHIFPQRLGGKDVGDNLIYACRSCNSSKGGKDLMEWMQSKEEFLPLMVIRRYLKLTITYCLDNALMEHEVSKVSELSDLPFKLKYIPLEYPSPNNLILNSK
jgi:hypothetical protein